MTVRVPGCGASIFASSSASAMGINALIVALLAGLQRARRRAEAAALRSAFLAEASSEGEGQGATFVVLLPLTSVDERASVPRRVEPTGQMRERCSGRRRAS